MNRPLFLFASFACGIAGFFAGRMFSPETHSVSSTALSVAAPPLKAVEVRLGSLDVSNNGSVAKVDEGSAPEELLPAAERAVKQSDTFVAPRTLNELYEGIQRDGGSPADVRLAVMEKIGRMNPDQLQTLLTAEANNPDFFRRMRFDFQFAARRFAEIAPQMAAQLWLQNASLRFQADTLLGGFAKREPRAFVTWILTLPADSQRATASVVGSIAKYSPEEFAAIAPLIADTPSAATAARAAMQSMIASASSGADPSGAIRYAESLPAGPTRIAALAQLAQWPGIDLKEHPQISESIASLPREDAIRLGRDLEKNAADLPAGVARDAAFAASVRHQAEKDFAAATARMESLVGTPDYAAAARGYVDATASKDPLAAAECAFKIDPKATVQRAAALERVAREMFSKNPDEARAWVEKAPLTDDEYAQLTGRKRQR